MKFGSKIKASLNQIDLITFWIGLNLIQFKWTFIMINFIAWFKWLNPLNFERFNSLWFARQPLIRPPDALLNRENVNLTQGIRPKTSESSKSKWCEVSEVKSIRCNNSQAKHTLSSGTLFGSFIGTLNSFTCRLTCAFTCTNSTYDNQCTWWCTT